MSAIQSFTREFQQGNYTTAVTALSDVIFVAKMPPDIAHQYAFALRSLGRITEAKQVYKDYLKKYSGHPLLLNGFGNTHMAAGEVSEALKYFAQAHRAAPTYFDAVYNLARANLSLNKTSQAKVFFQQALALRPMHPNSLIGLANALQQMNETAQTIEVLLSLLKTNENHVSALNNLGNAYREQNQLSEALVYLERAYVLAQDKPEIVKNFAACLHHDKQVDRAQAIYELHIERFLAHSEFQKEYANFRWMLSTEEPFKYIIQGIALYPDNLSLLFMYVELLKKLDLFEEALALVKPLQDIVADNVVGSVVGNVTSISTTSTAVNVLTSKASKANLCSSLSAIYLGTGDVKQALLQSEQAIKLTSKPDPAMLNQYGYCLLASKQFKHAKNIYKKLIKREPNNQGWWTMYSSALRNIESDLPKYAVLNNYQQLVSAEQISPSIQHKYAGDFYHDLTRDLDSLHTSTQFPIEQTLRNGTQTFEDLFAYKSASLAFLRETIERRVTLYLEDLTKQQDHPFLKHLPCGIQFNNSWSVRLRSNGFHKSHFHPQGWLSGVFYVDVPKATESKGQGWLQFGKAEIEGLRDDYDYAVKPEKGLLVLFPSFFWHGTIPFASDETRLSVVVDIIPHAEPVSSPRSTPILTPNASIRAQ